MHLEERFSQHRSELWKLCYRMTGSAADADDLVQETFVKALDHTRTNTIEELKPWLFRVAINASRDHLRRRKREKYVGPWLPSPIETDGVEMSVAPDARYSELESVSQAFLVALEGLTPAQRAIIVLRDVVGYTVEQTASALDMRTPNVKTTHHRARAALASYEQRRVPITPEHKTRTQLALMQLFMALQAGDVQTLEALLAKDVRTLNDSDGEFFAAQVPIVGPERVIRFHLKLRRKEPPMVALHELNGLLAAVCTFREARTGTAKRAVITITLGPDGRIATLNTVVATRKLSHVRFPS